MTGYSSVKFQLINLAFWHPRPQTLSPFSLSSYNEKMRWERGWEFGGYMDLVIFPIPPE